MELLSLSNHSTLSHPNKDTGNFFKMGREKREGPREDAKVGPVLPTCLAHPDPIPIAFTPPPPAASSPLPTLARDPPLSSGALVSWQGRWNPQ